MDWIDLAEERDSWRKRGDEPSGFIKRWEFRNNLRNFFSPFHRAFWFTKFFHTNSCTFTYNYVLVF
jgi:hypothetical protein